jgi:hypothetical protein
MIEKQPRKRDGRNGDRTQRPGLRTTWSGLVKYYGSALAEGAVRTSYTIVAPGSSMLVATSARRLLHSAMTAPERRIPLAWSVAHLVRELIARFSSSVLTSESAQGCNFAFMMPKVNLCVRAPLASARCILRTAFTTYEIEVQVPHSSSALALTEPTTLCTDMEQHALEPITREQLLLSTA